MTTMGIDELVRWAWLQELPKVAPVRAGMKAPAGLGYANAWAATIGLSHQRASGWVNRFGAVFHPDAEGEPDPDALIVAKAVERLDDLVVIEHDGFDVFGAWGPFGRLGDRALTAAWKRVIRPVDRYAPDDDFVLRGLASTMVVHVAVTGIWPQWQGAAPKIVADCWPNGRPKWVRLVETEVAWDAAGRPTRSVMVEADGMNERTRRPFADAYRAERLDPDPVGVLAERIRWAMLHLWFGRLATDLDGLGGRTVLPPDRPEAPWRV